MGLFTSCYDGIGIRHDTQLEHIQRQISSSIAKSYRTLASGKAISGLVSSIRSIPSRYELVGIDSSSSMPIEKYLRCLLLHNSRQWSMPKGTHGEQIFRVICNTLVEIAVNDEKYIVPIVNVFFHILLEPCDIRACRWKFHVENGSLDPICSRRWSILSPILIPFLQRFRSVGMDQVDASLWKRHLSLEPALVCTVTSIKVYLQIFQKLPRLCEDMVTTIITFLYELLRGVTGADSDKLNQLDVMVIEVLKFTRHLHFLTESSSEVRQAALQSMEECLLYFIKVPNSDLLLASVLGTLTSAVCMETLFKILRHVQSHVMRSLKRNRRRKRKREGMQNESSIQKTRGRSLVAHFHDCPSFLFIMACYGHLRNIAAFEVFDCILWLWRELNSHFQDEISSVCSSRFVTLIALYYIVIQRHEELNQLERYKHIKKDLFEELEQSRRSMAKTFAFPLCLVAMLHNVCHGVSWAELSIELSQDLQRIDDWHRLPFVSVSQLSGTYTEIRSHLVSSVFRPVEGIVRGIHKEIHRMRRASRGREISAQKHTKAQLAKRTTLGISLCDLGGDILFSIFAFSSFKRVCRLSAVCRSFHLASTYPYLWKVLYGRKWLGCTSQYGYEYEENRYRCSHGHEYQHKWRDMFRRRHVSERKLRKRKNNGGFVCSYCSCSMLLSNKKAYEEHLCKHTVNKCPWDSCRASYSSKSQLQSHIKTHKSHTKATKRQNLHKLTPSSNRKRCGDVSTSKKKTNTMSVAL